MSNFILPSSIESNLFECEIHQHASGEFSVIIDGYRFLLPEAHSFENAVEHLEMFKEAFERGIRLVDYSINPGNDDYLFYDPKKENDVPL